MKKHVFLTLVLIFFLSLGVVCATDTISGDVLSEDSQNPIGYDDSSGNAISEKIRDNILSGDGENSFTQLEKDINNSESVLEITHDYKFNAHDDKISRINFEKNNFVINGNNHVIDADNLSAIFEVTGTNITINNLIFKNANASSGSVLYINQDSTVTTNNVTFENCTAGYGIVLVDGSIYDSNDDEFLDCTASDGVIFGSDSNLNFNNSLMKSSNDLTWGFIKTEGLSYICVYNSVFANTTSKYSTAIMGSGRVKIINTTFVNLHANLTAGAIGLKKIDRAYILNCTFDNVSSQKNGGAIYADVYSSDNSSSIEIKDSNFADCYSQFGGVILQLEGHLDVDNCNFTNNFALFDGGAIYVSWTSMTVANSRFNNNSVVYDDARGSFGGAIFADASNLILNNSEFTHNSAQYGGAICLYDADYDIKDNLFENNLNLNGTYDDIFTEFDGNSKSLENNVYSSDDSISLNNKIYDLICVIPGMKLNITNNSIYVDSIPSQFDLRDMGWVTPVKDQGSSGVCWAFGSAGAMETSILRFLGIEMDISENNMVDVSLRYSKYGSINTHEGGGFYVGANYALSWLGIVQSEYDVYDELGKISPAIAVNSSIHFQDIVSIRPCANASDSDHVKRALLEYGGLYVTYYASQDEPYFNEETGAQYCDDESVKADHGVVLVGWDDTYSKENFLITPPGDGAWIFKNSWGDSYGNEGYFYISYYDSTFLKYEVAYAYIFINDVEYNKNYQYGLQGSLLIFNNANEYRNNFVAIEDDLIAGVETYFKDAGVEYTVEIYVNDELMHVQNGISPFAGYHTIKLDTYIPIKKGDEFTAKIKSNCVPALAYSRQHFIENSSEILFNSTWTDAAKQGFVCNIKVFTVANDTKVKSFVIPIAQDIYVGEAQNITLHVPADATGNVTLIINSIEYNFDMDEGVLSASYQEGENYVVAVSDGSGELIITGLPNGVYNVSARYDGNYRYFPSDNYTIFKVLKKDPEMEIIDQENGTAIIKLSDNAAGKVTVKVGDETYAADVENGTATIDMVNNAPGTYSISADYSGDDTYNPISANSTVAIPKHSSPLSVDVNDIREGESEIVTVHVPEGATGKVTIEIDGKAYDASIKDNKAVFEVAGLALGEKTGSVKYHGDENFTENSTTCQFTVSKSPSDGNDTSDDADADVCYHSPESQNGTAEEGSSSISLANRPTGNPIIVLLLMLCAVGLGQFKRFKF